MTAIEKFIFEKLKLKGAAPFLQAFTFEEGTISIEVISFPDRESRLKVIFSNATMESLSFDPNEKLAWPIDIMGFDAYEAGNRLRFVLNCMEAGGFGYLIGRLLRTTEPRGL